MFILILFALSGVTSAQFNNAEFNKKNKYFIANLERCINSDNNGVRRSAIYMAGRYRIADAVPMLCARLNKEEDANIRVLIGLSLYYIGDEKGMLAVRANADKEKNPQVKKMYDQILVQYCLDFNLETMSTLK